MNALATVDGGPAGLVPWFPEGRIGATAAIRKSVPPSPDRAVPAGGRDRPVRLAAAAPRPADLDPPPNRQEPERWTARDRIGAAGCRDIRNAPAGRHPAAGTAAAEMPRLAVTIFKPARNVVQAGHGNSKRWVLEFEPRGAPTIEPLMGWTSSHDTLQQVRLTFSTREQAVAFAERQGWAYSVFGSREPDCPSADPADVRRTGRTGTDPGA